MQLVRPDVQTICVGQAASMGAVLLAAGTNGKRFALPNSRILIHQPWGGTQGQASDIAIQAKEILRIKDRLNQILAFHTKQPRREDRDRRRPRLHHGRGAGEGLWYRRPGHLPAREVKLEEERRVARSSVARSATRTRTTSAS